VNQALVGALAVSLTATAAAGVLAGGGWTLLGIGWAPLAIAFSYATGMHVLHRNRAGPPFMSNGEAVEAAREAPGLRGALLGFALAALVILLAARYLAYWRSRLRCRSWRSRSPACEPALTTWRSATCWAATASTWSSCWRSTWPTDPARC
jgi:hypothetical protein